MPRRNQMKKRSKGLTNASNGVPLKLLLNRRRVPKITSLKFTYNDRIIIADNNPEDEHDMVRQYNSETSNESSWHRELCATGLESKIKWHTLKHNGPVFPPPYDRLPSEVRLIYDAMPIKLSEDAEEAATFYAKLMNLDIAQKPTFRENFFRDFHRLLDPCQRKFIQEFSKCDFKLIHNHFQRQAEQNRQRSKEQRRELKRLALSETERFGYCQLDGQREAIGNFHIEPPGIFQGRGNHPLSGQIKPRVRPEDVTINCSPGCAPVPPEGHIWKAIQHNNTVSWLAHWKDVMGKNKYIKLSSASRLQSIRDLNKFEIARSLSNHINDIRKSYSNDWFSVDSQQRQRGVALYLIDRLTLRVGNEKDENTAETEGCCTLRVRHLTFLSELQGVPCVVIFNFLGKDSIEYYKKVSVNPMVYHNLCYFVSGKKPKDFVFNLLTPQYLNKHLNYLMNGLTAKVFRTYKASKLVQSKLNVHSNPSQDLKDKLNTYKKANILAAELCNHQRSLTKANALKLNKWQKLIQAKRTEITRYKKTGQLNVLSHSRDRQGKSLYHLRIELSELQSKLSDATAQSTLALNTSKVNYLDPRITVAWSKRYMVPIEKLFNASLRNKFKWAIRATDANFQF